MELISTRVSAQEKRLIGAAARLAGKSVTAFMRALIVPAASRQMEKAAQEIIGRRRDKASV